MDKVTQGFLGRCEGCDCHGHASYCVPDTGKCVNCVHFTTGLNSEKSFILYIFFIQFHPNILVAIYGIAVQ